MYQTYVGISTIDFDLRGSVLFRARLDDSELKNYSRRVTRTGTLDGEVSIIDSGYSHGDRTITINTELTESQITTLTYIFQNYSQVILALPEGIFTASLSTMNNVYGTVTLQILINEKLTTSPDELPIYYCARDDTFTNINHWSLTKLHGTESATPYLKGLTDWECRLDIADGINSQLNMLYQYILPVGDFDVRIDVADYTPDLATAGFTLEFKLKDSLGTYFASVKYLSTATGVFQVTRTFKDGVTVTTDTAAGVTEPGTLKVERVGNDISTYYFANSWSSAYTRDYGANSGEIDQVEIIMTSGVGNRGGLVDIDNLLFHSGCPNTYPKAWSTTCTSTTSCTSSTASTSSSSSSISTTSSSTTSTSSSSSTASTVSTASTLTTTTSSTSSTCSSSTSSSSSTYTTTSSFTTTTTYSCQYDEHFNALSNWQVTTLFGTETASISANKLLLDVPNGINGQVKCRYLYSLPSGDFNVNIAMSDYTPDHTITGPWAKLMLTNPSETIYATALVQGDDVPATVALVGFETRAGGTPSNTYKVLGSTTYDVQFSIKRIGTTLSAHWNVGSGWTLIASRDFAGDASALEYIYLILEDNALNGGEIKCDELTFGSNCPDGTIAWTTTSTTTTCTTTTASTLSTTTSCSSTCSSSSSSSSTASTISTTSSSSSTASTLSTTTSSFTTTCSSSSSTSSSTASTLSTLSTTSSTASTFSTTSSTTSTLSTTSSCSTSCSTTTLLTTTSSTSSTASTLSTLSTASTLSTTTSSCSSSSSTASTLSTQSTTHSSTTTSCSSTTSSCSSSSTTASTLSTTSSCSSSSSTASTLSTTTSTLSTASTTCSTASTLSSTSSSSSTASTASTLSSTSSSSSTASTASTLSTLSTTTSSLSTTTTTTYKCAYDDGFANLDDWDITKKDGSETVTITAGKARLDLPDSTDAQIDMIYRHEAGTGDLEITLDVSNHTPDATPSMSFHFRVTGDPDIDLFTVYFFKTNATNYRVNGQYEINGGGVNSFSADDLGNVAPTKLRLIRNSTTMHCSYYNSGWTEIGNVDFGAYASNLTDVRILFSDNASRGGYVDIDNLTFIDGCPSGSDFAWTTTTTTTTTTISTTTTTSPP